ncbi:MAG: cation:proton antiporter [Acidimicrobiales bacterium]|nr:cation:proton antiporter [Acidimicrobiales bacterium]
MSADEATIGLATIVVFGVGAQWIARRVGIPSLLLLLPAGLLAGDVLGLVKPEELFGDLLSPLVTLLVALLLFQAATQLRLADLPSEATGAVIRLVTIGLAVTLAGAVASALLFLDVDPQLAIVAGAVLVVSGPTVVGPLLDVVRPRHPTASILRWEGTTLDPLGATVGVMVLNLVLAADRGGIHPGVGMGGRFVIGVAAGTVAALVLIALMSRFWLTDDMEAAVALMLAAGAYAVAELLASEAGLFATVAMGVLVANQRTVATDRIQGFGETLEVLIIGTLFITLGALVKLDDLGRYLWPVVGITVTLVLVVRPITVAASLARTQVPWRDRAMIAWMDPRGVVAAATATTFTVSLNAAGFEADFLLPVTFGVILGCGLIYGLTAKAVAKGLGVAEPAPTGVTLVGDDPWLRAFAACLSGAGVDVLLVTTTPLAPDERPESVVTVSLADGVHRVREAIETTPAARAIVSLDHGVPLTLFEPDLVERFGRRHVLTVPREAPEAVEGLTPLRATAPAFRGHASRDDLGRRHAAGAVVCEVTAPLPAGAVLLATVTASGGVHLRRAPSEVGADDTLIALVDRPA